MPQTTRTAPIRSAKPSGSSRKTTPTRTAVRATAKMKAAPRLASPARTSANQITHAAEMPTSDEYSMLATNPPVHEISAHDSTTSPSAVSITPPTRNGTATAQRVETLISYFLKNTVPSAQESAEPAPKATPKGDIASPEKLPALTAAIPENPSRRPASLAAVRGSPRINHASNPTSI